MVIVVGSYPRHALVVGIIVGLVVRPCLLIVVHMQDEQTCTRQASIPPCLLAVLQQVVFVVVAFIIYNVRVAAFSLQSRHVADVLGVEEFRRRFPSRHPALVAGVARRLVAVIVVRTAAHQVPVAHALTSAVVGVVEVGIAEAVTELMAHRANTGNGGSFLVSYQLATTSVGVDCYAVECLRTSSVAIVFGRCQRPLMRPNGAGSTAVGLALAGIDYIDLLHD